MRLIAAARSVRVEGMVRPASLALLDSLASLLGPRGFTREAEAMEPWLSDWRGRFHGRSDAILSPKSTEETAAIVSICWATIAIA